MLAWCRCSQKVIEVWIEPRSNWIICFQPDIQVAVSCNEHDSNLIWPEDIDPLGEVRVWWLP